MGGERIHRCTHVFQSTDDLAGGFLATMSDQKSSENLEIAEFVRKYNTANPDYSVEDRVQMGRYIENMTSVTTNVEAMHGAGSPQAQRIVRLGQAGIEQKIKMADAVINGTDNAPGLNIATAERTRQT